MISVLMELGQNKVEGAEDFFYVFNSFFFSFYQFIGNNIDIEVIASMPHFW